jgi:hypothetical protein
MARPFGTAGALKRVLRSSVGRSSFSTAIPTFPLHGGQCRHRFESDKPALMTVFRNKLFDRSNVELEDGRIAAQ